jgi:alpha-glucosidase (family GH31 glycosyl hydrolase)
MLGDSILVTPVLKSGNSQLNITTLNVYIPSSSNFIDFYTGKVSNPGYNSIDVPFSSTVPMFLREGKIIHLQNVDGIKRSRELNNRFRLAIAFAGNDQYMYASGTILSISNYSDDNIIANCMGTNSCVLNITAQATSVGNFMTFTLNFVGAV